MSFNGPSHKGKFKEGDRVTSKHGTSGTIKQIGHIGEAHFVKVRFDGERHDATINLCDGETIGDHLTKAVL